MLNMEEKIFRAWSYFRTGYSTYIAFILGIFSFTSTTYYLAINNIPFLLRIFPNVSIYIIFLTVFLPPLAITVGWIHMKKSLAYPSQVFVGIESNPYTYKIPPGISTEVSWPLTLLNMKMWEAILKSTGALTPEFEEELKIVRKKIESLLRGEMVESTPKGLRIVRDDEDENTRRRKK